MRKMSFTSRDTARAADILRMAIEDKACSVWLTLAGSTSAGGCMHVYRDMLQLRHGRRGGRHRRLDHRHGFLRGAGLQALPGAVRRSTTATCAPSTSTASTTPISTRKSCRPATRRSRRSPTAWSRGPIPRASSSTRSAAGSRRATRRKPGSLIQTAFEEGCPIFCPAFTDSSAGFGLVKHQVERIKAETALSSPSTRWPTSAS